MIPRYLVIIWVSIFIFSDSVSAKMGGLPLEQFLARATIIAVIKISSGKMTGKEDGSCAFAYNVIVEELIRGKRPTSIFTQRHLAIGEEYFLVAAESTPWSARKLGIDISSAAIGGDALPKCEKKNPRALVAGYDELFKIWRGVSESDAWITITPDTLIVDKNINTIIGSDRVDITDYKIDQPPPDLFDYVRLEDVLVMSRHN